LVLPLRGRDAASCLHAACASGGITGGRIPARAYHLVLCPPPTSRLRAWAAPRVSGKDNIRLRARRSGRDARAVGIAFAACRLRMTPARALTHTRIPHTPERFPAFATCAHTAPAHHLAPPAYSSYLVVHAGVSKTEVTRRYLPHYCNVLLKFPFVDLWYALTPRALPAPLFLIRHALHCFTSPAGHTTVCDGLTRRFLPPTTVRQHTLRALGSRLLHARRRALHVCSRGCWGRRRTSNHPRYGGRANMLDVRGPLDMKAGLPPHARLPLTRHSPRRGA